MGEKDTIWGGFEAKSLDNAPKINARAESFRKNVTEPLESAFGLLVQFSHNLSRFLRNLSDFQATETVPRTSVESIQKANLPAVA